MRQPQPMRTRSFEHTELVPEGEDFELQNRSRAGTISKRDQQRHEDRHRSGGYSPPAVTAMVPTRMTFPVGTARGLQSCAAGRIPQFSDPRFKVVTRT